MADERIDPQGDEKSSFERWSQRPAVGRRGTVLAVLIPLLIAACGFGIVSWIAHDSGGTGSVLRVPTSEWIPGQSGGNTPIQGTLEVDDQHCLYLDAPDGSQVWAIWPAGFTARINDDGLVGLYDGGDDLVARDGQKIQMTGVIGSAAAYSGDACLPDSGDVAEVQSDVTVIGS